MSDVRAAKAAGSVDVTKASTGAGDATDEGDANGADLGALNSSTFDDIAPEPSWLGLDAILDDPSVRTLLCCGSGGVGKTTTAAALGLYAAERGRTVVVLTIDPARRLAQAMNLVELDNTPREVPGVDTTAGGRLDAMMLDMKRTFDDVVLSHADDERARQILDNPFYNSLSSSFAGTQEYMAMEKLGQLRDLGTWDLVVVDTPPSRSALDFLDAPKRLASFLDGRFVRMISRPARGAGRVYMKVVNLGMAAVSTTVSRLLGASLLRDVQTFLSAFETLFGGFRERAEATYARLSDPESRFLVVATPERDALREASFFVERLQREHMPLAGLVLNRMHMLEPSGLTAEHANELAHRLDGATDRAEARRVARSARDGVEPIAEDALLTAALLRAHASATLRAAREESLARGFVSAHPDVAIARAPAIPGDVNTLTGLRRLASALTSRGMPL